MKKYKLILILLTSVLSYSQIKEYDIHILIEKEYANPRNIKIDSLVWQKFTLSPQVYYEKKSFFTKKKDFFTDKGRLVTTTKVSTLVTYIKLEYKNINNNNMPIIIKKENGHNIIKYPSTFQGQDIKNILKILKGAKNIFIIESEDTFGYYMAKKVKLIGLQL